MWSLERPETDAVVAFDASRSLLRRIGTRKARIEAARDDIVELMARYEVRGEAAELHLFQPHELTAGTIARSEMKLLYESGLLRVGAGRHIYDALMALAPNRRCPYCGHRRVRQLDHFLPQSKYPAFSVTPLNLVPSCSDCNKDKLDGDASALDDIPLHPYFDNIDHVCWLKAHVLEGPMAVFLYEIDDDCELCISNLERLNSQFKNLSLAELYTTEANDELSSIRVNLRKQFAIDGAESVRIYLEDEFLSARSHRVNAWRTALYEAAYQSDWFCGGGFDDPDLP